MKLGIGTAQFGMDYGVSNRVGRTTLEEVKSILAEASIHGIRVLDTAAQYGKSEETLGMLLPSSSDFSFDITTKLPRLVPDNRSLFDPREVNRLLESSLLKLQQKSVYGLMLHCANDLLSPYGSVLMEQLLEMKASGQISKIGVSVYAEDEIQRILDHFPIDLIQLPVNVFDQRLIRNGILKRCKEHKIEVHARSVFLQGLLLMDPDEVPSYFQPYATHIRNYHSFLSKEGIHPVEAALTFVNELKEVDVLICGINNRIQLLEIVSFLQKKSVSIDFSSFAFSESKLLNPSNWKI